MRRSLQHTHEDMKSSYSNRMATKAFSRGDLAKSSDQRRYSSPTPTTSRMRYILSDLLMVIVSSTFTLPAHAAQLLYYFVITPVRIGLFYDPSHSSQSRHWSTELSVLSTFDLITDIFGICIYVTHLACWWKMLGVAHKDTQDVNDAYNEAAHQRKSVHRTPQYGAHKNQRLKWPNSNYVADLFDIETIGTSNVASANQTLPTRPLLLADHTKMFVHTLATFPVELLVIKNSSNLTHIVRLTKLLCLYLMGSKVLEGIHRRIEHWRLVAYIQERILRVTLFKFMVAGICWIHWTALSYLLIAHVECGKELRGCDNQGASWALRDQLVHASNVRKYLRVVYWATRTIVTLGFADTTPTTVGETVFVVIMEFAGTFWSAFVIVAWAYLFSSVGNASQTQEIFISHVKEYMDGVPQVLQDRIIAYLQHEWKMSGGLNEDKFLSVITVEKLQSRFHHELKATRLKVLPFFAVETTGFLNELAAEMKFETFAPLDWLFEYPETEQIMYIITYGYVAMLSIPAGWRKQDRKNTTKVYTCIPGDTVGALSLFGPGLFRYAAFADTFVQALRMDTKSFQKVLAACYPDKALRDQRQATVNREAERTYQDFAARRAKQKHQSSFDKKKNQREAAIMIGFKRDAVSDTTCYWEAQRQREECVSWEWYQAKSKFRWSWNCCRFFCSCYVAFDVIFVLIFCEGDARYTNFVTGSIEYVITFGVELFTILDIILRFKYFEDSIAIDQLVSSATTSSFDAFRTGSLTKSNMFAHLKPFGVDIVSCLPISLLTDLICEVTDTKLTSLNSGIYWFRLLRLLRLWEFPQITHNVLQHVHSSRQLLLKSFLAVIFYCHFFGCLWYNVGHNSLDLNSIDPIKLSREECLLRAQTTGTCSWTLMDRLEVDHKDSLEHQYLRSLYFSISTLTTVAYGDIVAYTDSETISATIMIFVGGFICFGVTGALTAAAARLASQYRDLLFQDHLRTRFFGKTHISKTLQQEIRQYYHIIRQQQTYLQTEKELSTRLSRGLWAELSVKLFQEICSSASPHLFTCLIPILEDKSNVGLQTQAHDFLSAVCCRLKRQIVFREDHVVIAGEPASSFYIICSGQVQALEPISRSLWQLLTEQMLIDLRYANIEGGDGVEYARIDPPAVWSVDCIAVSMTEIVSLKLADLVDVLNNFPTIRAIRQHHDMILMRQARKERACVVDNISRYKVQKISGMLNESSFPVRSRLGSVKRQSMRNVSRPSGISLRRLSVLPQNSLWSRLNNVLTNVLHVRRKLFRSSTTSVNATKVSNMEASMTYNSQSRALTMHSSASWQRQSKMEHQRSLWDSLIGGIVVYNMYIVVLRLVFLPSPSTKAIIAFTFFDYLFDSLLLLDIYLKLNVFPPRLWLPGKPITVAQIRKFYRQKWFTLDILASLPLYYVGSNYHLMTWFRLPRLLRSFQMIEITETLQTFILTHLYTSRRAYSLLSLFKVLVIFIFCCHFAGCIFYAIASSERNPSGWIWKDIVLMESNKTVDLSEPVAFSKTTAYIRAFYWALSSITVINYGDVVPTSFYETFWACLVCLFGLFVISSIEGEIVEFFTSIDRTFSTHRQHLEVFHDVSRVRGVHSALRSKAERYLKLQYEIEEGLNPHHLFTDLIVPLKERIFMELEGSLIRVVPLWRDILNPMQVQELCALFVVRLYLPSDIIIYEQSLGKTLHVIKTGTARVVHIATSMEYTVLRSGQMFGELSFFIPASERLASVLADTVCEVLELDRPNWEVFATRVRNKKAAEGIEAEVAKLEKTMKKQNDIDEDREESEMEPGVLINQKIRSQSFTSGMQKSQRFDSINREKRRKSFDSKGSAPVEKRASTKMTDTPKTTRSFRDLIIGPVQSSIKSIGATKATSEEVESTKAASKTYNFYFFSISDDVFIETSQFRYIWDCIKFVMTTYFTIAIPMRVAFYDDIMNDNGNKDSHWSAGALWVHFEHVVDAFFWTDIIIRLLFFRPVIRGAVVQSRRECIRHYFKTGFYLDVIGSTPFEHITHLPIKFFHDYHTLSVSLFRLETLVRCAELEMLWLRAEAFLFYNAGGKEDGNPNKKGYLMWIRTWRQTTMSAAKVVFIALISSHWITCLWYVISHIQWDARPESLSWLTTSYMLSPDCDSVPVDSISFVTKYFRSYHYAIGSISAISYGDISARNLPETIAQIIIIFLSMVFFGYITGNCQKILERMCLEKVEYEEHILRVKQFSKLVGMSPSFVQKVCDQFARYHQPVAASALESNPIDSAGPQDGESSANLAASGKLPNTSIESSGVNGERQTGMTLTSFFSATSNSFMSTLNTSSSNQKDMRCMFLPLNPKWHLRALDHLSSQLRADITVYMRRQLLSAAQRRVMRSSAVYSSSRSSPHPFEGFDPVVVRAILMRLHIEVYEKKETLFEQEGLGKCMYFIERGVVLLERDPTLHSSWYSQLEKDRHVESTSARVKEQCVTRTMIRNVKCEGEFFGAASLLDGIPRDATCSAITRIRVAILREAEYREIISLFPEHEKFFRNVWNFDEEGGKEKH
uniref:Voltagegated Ion Channel (VIC) Superfamily putative n=1 Tax=Albugo laibachii Nc14 TaxID=890382 RepID=F0WZ37_9STRA|nr:Voltagegated Ion Channel (VIC) Superfamily putative [Albugo laibachii Nc14]|eukprot:CCA26752.1 Voltagegated Ion Channel (VIC) Superfamily putative [Albugo laibachii Nc14]